MNSLTIEAVFRAQNLAISRGGDQIYHYCSIESLVAISNSNSVRFGALPHMNDPEEYRYGLRFVAQSILEFMWDAGEWSEFDIEKVFEAFRLAFRNILLDVYIFCLSQEGDRLSLWRAYGHDGEGCSIVFSKSALMSLPTRGEQMSFFLTPVVYTERKREIIKEAMIEDLKKVLSAYSAAPEPRELASRMIPHVALLPMVLKSYEYNEEFEWRLIAKINRALRKSDASPVYEVDERPRLDVDLSMMTGGQGITEVILGPVASGRSQTIEDQLDRSLASAIDPPTLSKSNISYRNRVTI